MLGIGYTDAFRPLHAGEIGHFTFWDYFRQAFENNRGIRIDHVLLSTLADRLESCEIDKGPRGREKPSEHAHNRHAIRSDIISPCAVATDYRGCSSKSSSLS
jgi:exonuclease III